MSMMRNHLVFFGLLALAWVGIASIANADEVDELIDVLRLRDEMKNQYDECIESSRKPAEENLGNSIKGDFEGVPLDSEDLAILSKIYLDFWSYGCDYWEGEEIIDFHKVEFRNSFTSKEIRELIKFYKTPLGNKLNDQWIEIDNKIGKILADRQYSVAQEAQKLWEEQMEKFYEHLEIKIIEGSTEDGV
ncbi:MAG: DUF2059 domain-containing protein [Desulfobacteraceae bacterium]|nr:DUF2059 domain-containing protein [Desulfobacteraceae bacterium]